MNKKKIILPFLVILAGIVAATAAFGSKKYGEKIPKDATVTKLKEIASNPSAYKDKEVVLKGNFGDYCCDTDFSYKEGLEGVEVVPKGFRAPKAKRGAPMTLYGVVRFGKVEAEEEQKNEKEEVAHTHFFIEAIGMELR